MSSSKVSLVLQECSEFLVENGFYSPKLVTHLFSKQCINAEEMEEVISCPTQFKSCRRLLSILGTKPDSVLDTILGFLHADRTQSHLERVIYEATLKFDESQSQKAQNSSQGSRQRKKGLPTKWWPEHKELITSFVDRRTGDGTLVIEFLRNKLAQQSANPRIVSNKCVIVGMGGIGKSSTAKWYGNTYSNDYNHIIWVNSEGQSAQTVFVELAKELDVFREPGWSLSKFVSKIYDELQGTKCLFVFDNAEKFGGEHGLQLLLPKNDVHHTIITSRNHDWGNLNEFGLYIYELGVFTNSECCSLLLKSLGQEDDPDKLTILELGAELGFLPLALQCAVATIRRSTRYTVASYLERIRKDIKILVDKQILNEYERSISATLALSIDQIEQDEKIDAECREVCKFVLDVAAFCEANDIPEKLFMAFPTATKDNVQDGVDRLREYSLIREEGKPDHEKWRTLEIHRLLQHVRRNFILESGQSLSTVEAVLQCLHSNLELASRHGVHAWNLATEAVAEIQLTQMTFLLDISKVDYDERTHKRMGVNAFYAPIATGLKVAVCNLQQVCDSLDLLLMQVQFRLIDIFVLLKNWKDAGEVLDSLLKRVPEARDAQFRENLDLHLRVLGVQVEKSKSDLHSFVHIKEGLVESYTKVLEELVRTNYDGVLNGTKMYRCLPKELDSLSLRTAFCVNFALTVYNLGYVHTAANILIDELIRCVPEPTGLLTLQFLADFLDNSSYSRLLPTICPTMYHVTKQIVKSQRFDCGQHQNYIASVAILYTYVLRQNQTSCSISHVVKVLKFLNLVKCSSSSDMNYIYIADAMIQISDELLRGVHGECGTNELAKLNQILECAWNKFCPVGKKKMKQGEYLCTLLKLNTVYSSVLLSTGNLKTYQSVHTSTWDILVQGRSDRVLHKDVTSLTPDHLVYAATSPETSSSAETVMRDRLKLIEYVIDKFLPIWEQKQRNLAEAWPFVNYVDDACYILVKLKEFDRATSFWDRTLLCVNVELIFPFIIKMGHRTLNLVEVEKPEMYRVLVKSLASRLGQGQTMWLAQLILQHIEIQDYIQLLVRVLDCKEYGSATILLSQLHTIASWEYKYNSPWADVAAIVGQNVTAEGEYDEQLKTKLREFLSQRKQTKNINVSDPLLLDVGRTLLVYANVAKKRNYFKRSKNYQNGQSMTVSLSSSSTNVRVPGQLSSPQMHPVIIYYPNLLEIGDQAS